MINHARTLLLNVAGSTKASPDFPGEEYVPAEYKPVIVPIYLQTIRNVLFSPNPDRLMLNYRLREYLTLIHSTELEEFVTDLDSRITYWPAADIILFNQATFGATHTAITSPPKQLIFQGNLSDLTADNQLYREYRIDVTNSNTVTIQSLTWPEMTTPANYTTTSGFSSLVALPFTELYFKFEPEIGAAWYAQVFFRPILALTDVVAGLEAIPPTIYNRLFGTNNSEPYNTFRNLWEKHDELPYRLGGLVLAVIYRTNELLSGAN